MARRQRTNPNNPHSWRNRLPTSREEALRLDLSRYVSDTPCKRGHTGMRFSANNTCVACVQERTRQRLAK